MRRFVLGGEIGAAEGFALAPAVAGMNAARAIYLYKIKCPIYSDAKANLKLRMG